MTSKKECAGLINDAGTLRNPMVFNKDGSRIVLPGLVDLRKRLEADNSALRGCNVGEMISALMAAELVLKKIALAQIKPDGEGFILHIPHLEK